MEDPYWRHDTFLFDGTFRYYRNRTCPVRGKLHVSEEQYDSFSSLERDYLTTTRGHRSYVHMRPYIIAPNLSMTMALDPHPQPDADRGEHSGQTTGSRVQGRRELPVGNAQAWYYPEDRLLVLWECFLDSFVRDRPLEEDEHMSALWAGFETCLLERYPRTERIVTPWADPLWDSSAYQTFLTARRYTKDKPGVFIKLLK